jgi:ADP-ribose pyrophosphatase
MPHPGGHAPLSTRPGFEGRFLTVRIEDWPGLGPHEIVRHPGAAAVLPITPDEHVVLVRQLRPAIRKHLLEIPAGLLDVPGEEPSACAARELREETGYAHTSMEPLGGYYSSAGFTDEFVHLFWASTTAEPTTIPETGIEVVLRPLEQMVGAARSGDLTDVKTVLALVLFSSDVQGA